MEHSWLEARVDVPANAAEAVANFLVELGSPGLETEDRGGRTSIVAYFTEEASVDSTRRYLDDAGLGADSAVTARWIGTEDWAENWKAHFHPVEVGTRLFVCPPWAITPPPGRIALVIHPGMAFGTGHHPTTRGCLTLMERCLPASPGAVLDLGTGSGILAIAAALLGAAPVVAVDTDPLAREAVMDNARRNHVEDRIRVLASIDEVEPRSFPLLVANLQLDVLLALEPDLARSAAAGAVLIASGLLRNDAPSLLAAYDAHWALFDRIDEEEWSSIALRRRP